MDKVDWISVIYLVESNAVELHKQLPRRLPAVAAATGRLFQWSNPFRTLNYHGRRQPALLVIWTLLFIGYLPTGMNTVQVETSSWLERSDGNSPSSSSSSSSSSGCASCARERTLSALKEEEVRQWRIESTKQQILERLEMEARPPRVKTKDHHQLPLEAVLPVWPEHKLEDDQPPRQIILFPAKIFRNRSGQKHHQQQHTKSETLKFHITAEMIEAVLQSAVLWTAQSIKVDDESNDNNNNNTPSVIWNSKDVTEAVEQQIEQQHKQRHRYLSLLLPDNSMSFANRSRDERHPEPYLIVHLDSSLRRSEGGRSRKKRNTTPMCSPGSVGCCRESLYISFKDVGWDDWIVSPRGFHAFYCRGSCRTFTAAASSANPHASLLQKLLSRDRVPEEARPHLAPCCAPTRLSPLTVFYSDESDVIKQRNLPNMIVESCGCAL